MGLTVRLPDRVLGGLLVALGRSSGSLDQEGRWRTRELQDVVEAALTGHLEVPVAVVAESLALLHRAPGAASPQLLGRLSAAVGEPAD